MSASRRHREISESYLDTLLNSATVDQLRSVLIKLSDTAPSSIKNRDDAINQVFELGRTTEVIEELLNIEATSPAKHSLILKYSGSINLSKLRTGALLAHQSDEPSLHFKVAFKLDSPNSRIITFEHTIDVVEWRTTEEDDSLKKRDKFKVRHPVILRTIEDKNLIVIFYPGFSQGSGIKKDQKITYQAFLINFLDKIQTHFGISLSTIPVEACVKALSDANSKRVKIVRTNFESARGRMSLSAPSNDQKSVDEYLTSFISPFIKEDYKKNIHKAVREALKNTTPDSLAVLWVEEDLVTRLNFWDIGTEFLFIWYGSNQSYYSVHKIFDLIISITNNLNGENRADKILRQFMDTKEDVIITPSSLAAKFELSIDQIKKCFMDAVKAGIIYPVYRIRTTELLIDSRNDWTEELITLRRKFETSSNKRIDGSDPDNIEVAFKKSSAEHA